MGLFDMLLPSAYKNYMYMVETPKYIYRDGKKQFFGMTKEDIYDSLPKGKKINQTQITYLKGWAESDISSMNKIAFDPETRRLRKFKAPTKSERNKALKLMGSDVDARKSLFGIT